MFEHSLFERSIVGERMRLAFVHVLKKSFGAFASPRGACMTTIPGVARLASRDPDLELGSARGV